MLRAANSSRPRRQPRLDTSRCRYPQVRPDILDKEEGRKFLAALFQLSPQITRDLHQVLRRDLLDYKRRSIWECIGEVYFRAYLAADGQVALALEDIVQSYMEMAVKLVDEPKFARLLCVLDAFHAGASDHKKVCGCAVPAAVCCA